MKNDSGEVIIPPTGLICVARNSLKRWIRVNYNPETGLPLDIQISNFETIEEAAKEAERIFFGPLVET